MYSIHWSKLAEITFSEEMDFIFEKGDRLLSRIGFNTFNDTDNKK
jgi:hypothetical protein